MAELNALDGYLRAFIQAPDDFLETMSFVKALHQFPVLASERLYAIEVDGQAVVPVFTDKADWEAFLQTQASARNQKWVERQSLDVLEEVIVNQLTGMVYNLKKTGDVGNSTLFQSSDMITVVNSYTTILNNLLGEANLAADLLEKFYMIPAFYLTREAGKEERLFPTLSNEDKQSYIPIFSQFSSFAKWYKDPEFGGRFRKAQGMITTGRITDIYRPDSGENDIEDTKGVVINPFDDHQILVDWEAIIS